MTTSDFLAEVLGPVDAGQYGWVCAFAASPEQGEWSGRPYVGESTQARIIDRAEDLNTYFSCALFSGFDGTAWKRNKTTFHRLAALVVDDIDPESVLGGCTWALQTSPGKWQLGWALDETDPDTRDLVLIDRVMSALSARGKLGGNDSSGNAAMRYCRLPVGMNTKPRAAGPWRHQLAGWNPQIRWTLEDSCGAVGIDLDSLRGVSMPVKAQREVPVATDALASLIAPVSERSYHQSITSLAASMVGSGMFAGAVVQYLYALMDSIRPDGPGEEVRRWEARRAEIPRAVKSAEKFAPPERAPAQVTINLGAQVEEVASDLVALDWTVLEQTPPEAPEFLVDGWLPRRTTTLLSANGGVGKSNVALQLAVSMAIGADWLGIDTERSRVLILSAEDDARVVHFRVANICADSGVAMSALHNDLICYDMSAIDSTLWREGATDRMQWLADMTRKHSVDAVIIDNASDVFAGNENDRAQVRGFLRCLNQIAAGTDCAILLLAHVDKASVRMTVGKDTDSTFSGSTAWNNSVRSRWAMTREKERLILAHEKSNLGPKMEAIELEFDPTAKVFRRFGEVPGAAAARNTLRTARRREVLLAFEQAYQQDVRISAADRANMNARKCVQRFGGAEISRDEVDSIVASCRREKLLEVVSIKQKNGSSTQYIQISPAGRAGVSLA